ncbi:MAG: alpha/beta hydrolase [Candidatus Saccharimonadales bacterium]
MQRMEKHRGLRIIGYVLAVCAVIFAGVYMASRSFREEVDEMTSAVYVHFVINPTMSLVADKVADVPYCNSRNRMQRLDVFTPKHSDEPTPLVVYIHGGSWSNGSKSNHYVSYFGPEIVKNGMTLVSMNYRLSPANRYPAQNDDVACALKYLRDHAEQLHIDTTRIALMGDSAGGQLAAATAFHAVNGRSVKAVVAFYSPFDVWAQITRTPRPDKGAINYIGGESNRTLAEQASPLYVPIEKTPAFLLFHGTNDRIVHYDQSTAFARRLQKANIDVTVVPVSNANHHFDERSRPTEHDIMQQTATFLKRHLF